MLSTLSSLISWFIRTLPLVIPILQASAAIAVVTAAICNFVQWFRRSRRQQRSLQLKHTLTRQQQCPLRDRRQSGRRQMQSHGMRLRKVYSKRKMDDKEISKQKKDIQLPPE